MNCRIQYYTRFENEERTGDVLRVLLRNRNVIKSEGDVSGPNWFMTREKFSRGDRNAPGIFKEMRETKKLAQYFGIQNPPKRILPTMFLKTVTNEDGTTVEVAVKKRERNHYTIDSLNILCEAVVTSGKTLREYLKEEGRITELIAIYQKGRANSINFPMGKKGCVKGKKGKVSKYSEDDMKALGEAILASGLTFAEYIVKEKREGEKTALYARLKNLGIEVKQGKRGRKKGIKIEKSPEQIAA